MEGLSEYDLELIDRYVQGTASAEDVAKVEQRKSDPSFLEQLRFVESAGSVITAHEEKMLREEFRKIRPRSKPKNNSGGSILLWILIMAGIVIAGYLLYQYFSDREIQPDRLYAEFYTPMPNLVAPIEQGDPDPGTSSVPYRSYERGDYRDAIRWFESNGTETADSRFYYGLSLLADDREGEAILILEETASEKSSEYSQASQWYLALAFLKNEDIAACKRVLTAIVAEQAHRYRADAIGLQNYLE